MSGATVFAAATQGNALRSPGYGSRGTCVPGSRGTIPIAEMVLARLAPPGHSTDSWLKHSPSPSVKQASLLIPELWPER